MSVCVSINVLPNIIQQVKTTNAIAITTGTNIADTLSAILEMLALLFAAFSTKEII